MKLCLLAMYDKEGISVRYLYYDFLTWTILTEVDHPQSAEVEGLSQDPHHKMKGLGSYNLWERKN